MPVKAPLILSWPRIQMAMATSSREALPARSPMPLMVHSTCRAPFATPASIDRKSKWVLSGDRIATFSV
jgi:hypothetical protein